MYQLLLLQKCIIHGATTGFDWSLLSFTVTHARSSHTAMQVIQLQTCHRIMGWYHVILQHYMVLMIRHYMVLISQYYMVLGRAAFLKKRFEALSF